MARSGLNEGQGLSNLSRHSPAPCSTFGQTSTIVFRRADHIHEAFVTSRNVTLHQIMGPQFISILEGLKSPEIVTRLKQFIATLEGLSGSALLRRLHDPMTTMATSASTTCHALRREPSP